MKAGLDRLINWFTHVSNELTLYWIVKGKTIMSRLYPYYQDSDVTEWNKTGIIDWLVDWLIELRSHIGKKMILDATRNCCLVWQLEKNIWNKSSSE
jgi:hypothetical protein